MSANVLQTAQVHWQVPVLFKQLKNQIQIILLSCSISINYLNVKEVQSHLSFKRIITMSHWCSMTALFTWHGGFYQLIHAIWIEPGPPPQVHPNQHSIIKMRTKTGKAEEHIWNIFSSHTKQDSYLSALSFSC